jgi:hypothetical protein
MPALIDRSRLTVNPPAKIRPSLIPLGGKNEPSVLVLDNFYEDPQYVRHLALSLDYLEGRARFPGFEARVSLDPHPALKMINSFVDENLVLTPLFESQFVFSMMSSHVDKRRRHQHAPHTDGLGILAALVYLNPARKCRGGTAFYRHKSTGLIEIPVRKTKNIAAIMRAERIRSLDGFVKWMTHDRIGHNRSSSREELELVADSTSNWELVRCVEMKFNRLILYFGSLFHSAYVKPGFFGETPSSRRLTQTMLLARKDQVWPK